MDAKGRPIEDPDVLERVRALAIPPAWRDVWISPSPGARLQATGVDAAGRKQYLYHPRYRAERERAKFERLLLFVAAPALIVPELYTDLVGLALLVGVVARQYGRVRAARERAVAAR